MMTPASAVPALVTVLVACSDLAGAQVHATSRDGSASALGHVHLATSCAPATAGAFDRAVALLHSFEFRAAIDEFTNVLEVDPTCAMAHWGIALSRWGNPLAPGNRALAQLELGERAVADARRLGAGATARERAYIDAVACLYADHEGVDQQARVSGHEQAMAALVAAYPADTEAKIFHALALSATAPTTDATFARQREAGEILESLWANQPDHPGLAHYIIHAYDSPSMAERARVAAERYARVAPAAAHALHMPSHTFTRLGMWERSVETNRRSMAVALADGSIAEVLHAADYAMYADLQMRRDSAAKAILDGLPGLAERFDVNAIGGAAPGSAGVFALAAIPARYALERRDWARAARLAVRPSAFPWAEAMTHFGRALGASHTGTPATARLEIEAMAAIRGRLAAAREVYWAEQVAIQQLAAEGWLAHVEGAEDTAFARLSEAAAREDATDKAVVSPGPLLPARELLGDLLMDLGRPTEALKEYRAVLGREPNRYRTLDGAHRAATASADRAGAAEYAAQLRRLTGH